MMTRYKIIVTFQGVAALEIEAESMEAARRQAKELTIADLARPGPTDIYSLQVGAREIVPVREDALEEEESAPAKPRPSGWYRPL
jgi:hypothetical protein